MFSYQGFSEFVFTATRDSVLVDLNSVILSEYQTLLAPDVNEILNIIRLSSLEVLLPTKTIVGINVGSLEQEMLFIQTAITNDPIKSGLLFIDEYLYLKGIQELCKLELISITSEYSLDLVFTSDFLLGTALQIFTEDLLEVLCTTSDNLQILNLFSYAQVFIQPLIYLEKTHLIDIPIKSFDEFVIDFSSRIGINLTILSYIENLYASELKDIVNHPIHKFEQTALYVQLQKMLHTGVLPYQSSMYDPDAFEATSIPKIIYEENFDISLIIRVNLLIYSFFENTFSLTLNNEETLFNTLFIELVNKIKSDFEVTTNTIELISVTNVKAGASIEFKFKEQSIKNKLLLDY